MRLHAITCAVVALNLTFFAPDEAKAVSKPEADDWIVYTAQIGPPRPPPKPLKPVKKAQAMAFVADIDSLRYELYMALTREPNRIAYIKKVGDISRKAKSIFGDPVLAQPFAACASAAVYASTMWMGVSGIERGTAADITRLSSLVMSSIQLGDDYRRCRTEVEALPD